MELHLHGVVCKGASASINSETVTLTAKFECPFNAKIADKLNVTEHVYEQRGPDNVLRRFLQHEFSFGFESASVVVHRAERDPSPVTLRLDLGKFKLVQDQKDGSTVMKFNAYAPINYFELSQLLHDQRSGSAHMFVISGDQRELQFAESEEVSEVQQSLIDEQENEIKEARKNRAKMAKVG